MVLARSPSGLPVPKGEKVEERVEHRHEEVHHAQIHQEVVGGVPHGAVTCTFNQKKDIE